MATQPVPLPGDSISVVLMPSKETLDDSTTSSGGVYEVATKRTSWLHSKIVQLEGSRRLLEHFLVDMQIFQSVEKQLYVRISTPAVAVPLRAFAYPDDPRKVCQRKFCFQLATALDFLHDRDIIHGAVRTDNAFVDLSDAENPRCVLGAFNGEVKPSSSTLVTYAGWMAPELIKSGRFSQLRLDDSYLNDYYGEYRKPSDVYALACAAIEIHSGAPPMHVALDVNRNIPNDERCEVFLQEVRKLRPAGTSKRVWDVILNMMHPDPSRRFNATNAKEFFKCVDIQRIVRYALGSRVAHQYPECKCEGKDW